MQITVVQGASKHELSVDEGETIRSVKARLADLCSIGAEQQKLLVKGKEAADASTIAALGVADGARLMLLKNAQGHKAAPAAAGPAIANNPANNPAVLLARAAPAAGTSSAGAPEAAPPAVGAGSIELTVSHGKARYVVRCEAETSVIEVKRLLQALCGAPPAQQRLLVKGRQASERGASLASLGLGAGGTAAWLRLRRICRSLSEDTAPSASLAQAAPTPLERRRLSSSEARVGPRSSPRAAPKSRIAPLRRGKVMLLFGEQAR